MNFPEQELFSVEDVAARWKKSVSYVQDLTRRGKLSMTQADIKFIGQRKLKLIPHIRRQDLEQFERTSAKELYGITIKDYAGKYGLSEKTVRRYIKNKKVPARRMPGGRWLIFE